MKPDSLDQRLHDRARSGIVWYVKRLSANDTLAGDSNQAGPCISRDFLLRVFPELDQPAQLNQDVEFDLLIDSHPQSEASRAPCSRSWHNNLLHSETGNETRITGWGGIGSPLLDTEQTGALVVFAFAQATAGPTIRQLN